MDPDDKPLVDEETDKPWIPYRVKLMVFAFFGFFNCISMRINFNIALVAMVNFTKADNYNVSEECPGQGNFGNVTEAQGEFDWGPDLQSQLQGAFFYGYVFTQFPGGYLAEVLGARKVFGCTSLLSGLLSLLTPTVARWDAQGHALLGLRILMGIVQGPLYPSNHALWGQWAPRYERSQLATWAGSGAMLGMVVAQALTGYLCSTDFLGGWPSAFYVFGSFSVLWSIGWFFYARESPNQHTGLSTYERNYILQNNTAALHAQDAKSLHRPWRKIFTSVPFLAINVFSLMDGTAYYILFNGMPIYMKVLLKFDISQDGFLSALPYLGMWITSMICGPLADVVRRRGWLHTGATRKLFAFLGEGLVIVPLVCMGWVSCDRVLAVLMLTLCVTINGLQCASQPVNHLDIAPIYAGTLMGISNIFANVGGFISPILLSKITQDQPSRAVWQQAFFTAAGIYAFGMLFFVLFSSGEEQEWAKAPSAPPKDDEGEREEDEVLNGGIVPPPQGTAISTAVNC